MEELKQRAIQSAMEIFGCEAGSLLLYDHEKEELFFDVALGSKGEKVKTYRLKLGEGIAGYVALHKQPEIVNDVSQDPRFLRKVDEMTGFNTVNMLCVPLMFKGKIQGVLQVLNKRDE
ncbi:MAG: GAF domain-containing protein [Caldimicrobium sp.]|nr:GAF domain-containing protein [Caldimicrobium sp.]MCX7873909.1 GAF domain-containing protein [Caldimicrobium sp.]MDW8183335.1 GAF domain-containing protein [Caldimicrobium sp.]